MFELLKIPEISFRCFKVWERNLRVWLKHYRASIMGNFGEPLLYLIAFGYGFGSLVPNFGELSYIQFLAPGMLAVTAMNGSAYEATFGSYTRMVPQKTYDAIVVTPVNVNEVIAGDILWATTKGVINSLIMLIVMLVLNLLPSYSGILTLVPIALTAFFFASLSMVVTTISPSYEFFSYYFTLVISPMFLLSGVFFPIETLPQTIQKIAWFMPLTYSVDSCRNLVLGRLHNSIFTENMLLLLLSIPVFIIAINRGRERLIK
jgi:lipooligosaccharide transport system permease protein